MRSFLIICYFIEISLLLNQIFSSSNSCCWTYWQKIYITKDALVMGINILYLSQALTRHQNRFMQKNRLRHLHLVILSYLSGAIHDNWTLRRNDLLFLELLLLVLLLLLNLIHTGAQMPYPFLAEAYVIPRRVIASLRNHIA